MAQIHRHLIVDATLSNPPTSEEQVCDWLTRLVKAVDMEIFMPPQAKYCHDPDNQGVTGTVVITTSHASMHVWDSPSLKIPFGKFDLYSCRDFDTDAYISMVEEFGPKQLTYTLIERTLAVENGFHEITKQGRKEY